MIKRNNFKPYPFVFGGNKSNGGIGLSGPGGILWPIYPGVSECLLKLKSNNIPAPPLLPSIDFIVQESNVGDIISADVSFTFNMQRLLTEGSLSSILDNFAKVYYSYEGAKLSAAGTALVDMDIPEDPQPEIYIVFAYDHSGTYNEVMSECIQTTIPLDIMISLSGSLTADSSTDSRCCTISFHKLIMKLSPPTGTNILSQLPVEWDYTYSIDNTDFGIEVTTTSRSTPSPADTSITSLCIRVQNIECIDHPEQVGYLSFYWGGINAAMAQSATINVLAREECQGVLGPCWLPHTTFYPLIEINKTMPGNIRPTVLDIPEGDLSYLDTVEGPGIFQRAMSALSAEMLISNTGDLLNYPLKKSERGYSSFQPDYIDTRIIHDTCIYPITGPDDMDQITKFRNKHSRVTRTIYV